MSNQHGDEPDNRDNTDETVSHHQDFVGSRSKHHSSQKKKKIGARRGKELDNQQDVFKEAHSSIPIIMKEVV